MFGAGDKVGEGVLLGQHAPVEIPGSPHFAAAADMGNGIGHATVEQADDIAAEFRVAGGTIGTVAVEQESGGSACHFVLVAHQ